MGEQGQSWSEHMSTRTDLDGEAEVIEREFPYGLCPTQVDGRDSEGRPFYFRCRSGRWSIRMAWSNSDAANYITWRGALYDRPNPVHGIWQPGFLLDYGEGYLEARVDVDAKLDEVVGPGWTVSSGLEQVTENCWRCGVEFMTFSSDICDPCYLATMKWSLA